jgi:rare lipoprotein A
VRVTSVDSGNSVIVRINDRGPHIRSRIIDLSRAAAEELDMIHDGLATVRVEVLAWGGS